MVISIHTLFSRETTTLQVKTILDFYMYSYFTRKNIAKRIPAFFYHHTQPLTCLGELELMLIPEDAM